MERLYEYRSKPEENGSYAQKPWQNISSHGRGSYDCTPVQAGMGMLTAVVILMTVKYYIKGNPERLVVQIVGAVVLGKK